MTQSELSSAPRRTGGPPLAMRLLGSELLKLRTTRTFYGLMGSAVALIVIISAIAAAVGTFSSSDMPGEDLLSIAGLAGLFALVAGVIGVTSEFRHGTITPSLLVEPQRLRLLSAKLAAQIIVGLLLGALAYILSAVLIAGILSGRGIPTDWSTGDWVGAVIGGMIATALYGVLGLGVGALLRNQAGAIVVVLAWIFVIENLLSIIPHFAIDKYGLGGTAGALAMTNNGVDHPLGQVSAGLLLLLYTAVLVAAGAIVLRRRDISG